MRQLAYRRILLKLSGEALGRAGKGIEPVRLKEAVKELKSFKQLGVELGIVIGGGNIWRKREQGIGMDEVTADYLGMIATVINALALAKGLRQAGVKTIVQSFLACDVPGVECVNVAKARNALKKGVVVIFAGGTGKPFFTTDTAAAKQAVAIKAEIIIKASLVDGVYSADPTKVKAAYKYEEISTSEALRRNLKIMDKQAFALCARKKVSIIVCKWGRGVLSKVAKGEKVGTLVKS